MTYAQFASGFRYYTDLLPDFSGVTTPPPAAFPRKGHGGEGGLLRVGQDLLHYICYGRSRPKPMERTHPFLARPGDRGVTRHRYHLPGLGPIANEDHGASPAESRARR